MSVGDHDFEKRRERPYGRATEDVEMVELAEDFCEDFDGQIKQL